MNAETNSTPRRPGHGSYLSANRPPGWARGLRLLACFLLALLCILPGARSTAASQASGPAPTIVISVPDAGNPGHLAVSGHGFTAGSLVLVVFHDRWGGRPPDAHWVTASMPSLQPLQDLAPGEGFSFDTGGNIALFLEADAVTTGVPGDGQNPGLGPVTSQPTMMSGVACLGSILAQAYDQGTARWSPLVEFGQGCPE